MKSKNYSVYQKRQIDSELKKKYNNLTEFEKMEESNRSLVEYIEYLKLRKQLENEYYKRNITQEEKQEILSKMRKRKKEILWNDELEKYNFDIFDLYDFNNKKSKI